MKLFLISQTQNAAYDTYDAAVVAAPDENAAKHMYPYNGEIMTPETWKQGYSDWCNDPSHVSVRFLGEASCYVEQGVVCASFNAG
jgi:hypothetical protein